MKDMAAIILAAGKGKRMNSELPKVLHKVAGKSMLQIVCESVHELVEGNICLVIGNGAEAVRNAMGEQFTYAIQEQQLGTGHAVMQALPAFNPLPQAVFVLCGDTPLLQQATLAEMQAHFLASGVDCTVMSTIVEQGSSYGRIVRDETDHVLAIVEARDATPEQLQINEVNSGVYCFRTAALAKALAKVKPGNAQGEYYLTDVLAIIREQGGSINAYVCQNAEETMGVNDRNELAAAESLLSERLHMGLNVE